MCHGRAPLALTGQQKAEFRVGLREAGIEPDCFAVVNDGLPELIRGVQRHRQVQVRLRLVRGQPDASSKCGIAWSNLPTAIKALPRLLCVLESLGSSRSTSR